MKAQRGFSLIELLVVITILGLLAAIAVPAYSSYRQRANRAEARTTLLEAAQIAERHFVRNNSYIGADVPDTSPHRLYRIDFVPDGVPIGSAFTLTATAQGSQGGDRDCTTFSITSTGAKTGKNHLGVENPSCW